ncbi:MAG: magnesium transporter [Bacteroidetes bacterium]|nr:magnesium transporter [Bacteroidota bacterium]
MTALTTFHLSRLLGIKLYSAQNEYVGVILDLLIDNNPDSVKPGEPYRPRIVAVKTGAKSRPVYFDFRYFEVNRLNNKYAVICREKRQLDENTVRDYLPLMESILDKQIVDLNGKKLVRVNDIRIATVSGGTFVIAVDVGVEGLLRRLGISKITRQLSQIFRFQIPSKFILWDDVDTLDASNLNIRLGKASSKLKTLHPSDLADIIEELGHSSRTAVFSNLDEEQAADVLEEMEPRKQVDLIESLSVAKAADVLEKMPADEAADILDLLEDDKAEILLREMDSESSDEVRELLEYSDQSVGSIMSTDFISFHENETVEQALITIREAKPEEAVLYNLFVVNHGGKLLATVTLRDLVVSDPGVILREIMRKNPVSVQDKDKLDSVAELVSKYNMLALPVVNNHNLLEGMVVIDDIIEDLLGARKTK